jgi:hypothetical protein
MTAFSGSIALCESVTIARSDQAVWQVVSDYNADRRWRGGLVEMTPTPSGAASVGTSVHEVVRAAGASYVTDSVVTNVGPGYSYRFAGAGTSGRVSGGRSVRSIDLHAANFTYEINLELVGALRWFRPFVLVRMRRSLRSDLRRLQHLLETTTRSPSA